MKKSLILTIALLLITGIAAVTIAQSIATPETRVDFFETAYIGDASAAEGLTAELHETFRERLYWDSTLEFGSAAGATPLRTETALARYSGADNERQLYSPQADLALYTVYNGGDITSEHPTGLDKAYQELLQDALPDVEHSKRIRLADYYEYCPVSVYIQWDESVKDSSGRQQQSITLDRETVPFLDGSNMTENQREAQKIFDFFRIPVPDDQYMLISGMKNKQGQLTRQSANLDPSEDGDDYYIQTTSVAADNGFYFYLNSRSGQGKLMDFSQVPGGYGIYFLPVNTSADGTKTIDGDGLKMVWALDPEIYIDAFMADADGNLLIVSKRDGEYVADVIETAGYTKTQEISLGTVPGDDTFFFADWAGGDDYLYFCINRGDKGSYVQDDGSQELQTCEFIVLSQNADGRYEKAIDYTLQLSDLPKELQGDTDLLPWYNYADSKLLAWNGEKLAIARPSRIKEAQTAVRSDWVGHSIYYLNRDGCGIDLVILSADGIEYFGKYTSTLDQANIYMQTSGEDGNLSIGYGNELSLYHYDTHPQGSEPLKIWWN